MTVDPNALFLLERSGKSYKVKSSDLVSVGTSGDLLLCNSGGISYKVEFSRWGDVPDASLLLTNLNSQSYSVTGAEFKTLLGPPPLPSGNRSVSFGATNESGFSYMAVNNDTSNSYGFNGSGGGEARMTIVLRVNNAQQWWEPGDSFVFYWSPSGSISARTSAPPGSLSRQSVDQRLTGWGYSGVDTPFDIVNTDQVVPYIRFTGSGGGGLLRIASTKVNGITAGTGAGSGSLPGFRPTRSITNADGKVLMLPRYDWIDNEGEYIYPELQEKYRNGEELDSQEYKQTWMLPDSGLSRTDQVAEIAIMEPTIAGAVIPDQGEGYT